MTGQHSPSRAVRAQGGISLLELLVGITVSMLTVLVITQVFLASEKQRRIPAAGADAQVNGILALDALQRDVRQAGYGLSGGPWVGICTTGNLSEPDAVGLANLPLAPVTITPGSNTAPSDSIDILSSGKVNAALQIKLEEDHASGNGAFVVPSTLGIEAGDWLIVSSAAGAHCDAFQAQTLATAPPWGITPSGSVTTSYTAGSLLTNMGASPIRRRWSVSDTFRLRTTNLAVSGTPTPAAADDAYADIVLLRAFYAKDTDGNGSVDAYNTTAPTTRAEWSQVIGLRLAVVVRSPQWDKDEVTTSALQWNLGSATVANAAACAGDASSQCLPLSLTHTGTGSEWKHYRYRMYESLIPLRNLLWNAG
jgi:type IV pilus assembly protein PilW